MLVYVVPTPQRQGGTHTSTATLASFAMVVMHITHHEHATIVCKCAVFIPTIASATCRTQHIIYYLTGGGASCVFACVCVTGPPTARSKPFCAV